MSCPCGFSQLKETNQILKLDHLCAQFFGSGGQLFRRACVGLRELGQLTHGGIDLANAARLLFRCGGDFLHQIRGRGNRRNDILEETPCLLRQLYTADGEFTNLLRGHLTTLCQFANLGCHHSKPFAVFSGSGGFDGRIEGK